MDTMFSNFPSKPSIKLSQYHKHARIELRVCKQEHNLNTMFIRMRARENGGREKEKENLMKEEEK